MFRLKKKHCYLCCYASLISSGWNVLSDSHRLAQRPKGGQLVSWERSALTDQFAGGMLVGVFLVGNFAKLASALNHVDKLVKFYSLHVIRPDPPLWRLVLCRVCMVWIRTSRGFVARGCCARAPKRKDRLNQRGTNLTPIWPVVVCLVPVFWVPGEVYLYCVHSQGWVFVFICTECVHLVHEGCTAPCHLGNASENFMDWNAQVAGRFQRCDCAGTAVLIHSNTLVWSCVIVCAVLCCNSL